MTTLYDNVAAVLGSYAEDTPIHQPGLHWLRGHHRGYPVRLGIIRKGQTNPVGYVVAVYLGGRPINISIHDRARTTIVIRPEVRTGDAAFDQVYLVNGYPAEVIVAALDQEMRQIIAQTFGGTDPAVEVRDGELQWSPRAPGQPADIALWIERCGDLAGRLTRAFDSHYANLVGLQGRAAADAWVQEQMQFAQEMAAARGRRAVKILAILGLGIGLFLVVLFLFVLL